MLQQDDEWDRLVDGSLGGDYSGEETIIMDSQFNSKHEIHYHGTTSPSDDFEWNKVAVQEVLGQGVCDLIGGEVWEASLYMCSYLITRFGDSILTPPQKVKNLVCSPPSSLCSNSFLELGAGLGLPSFLLLNLYRQMNISVNVCITDYDCDLVQNINDTFIRQRYERKDYNTNSSFTSPKSPLLSSSAAAAPVSSLQQSPADATLLIKTLDWDKFYESTTASLSTSSSIDDITTQISDTFIPDTDDDIIPPAASATATTAFAFDDELKSMSIQDFIFGSALCYSHYHISLADTVRHFLLKGSKEFVCIQRGDRPGFEAFLARLEALNLTYRIEPLSADIIKYSHMISMESDSISSISSSSSLSSFSSIRVKRFTFPTSRQDTPPPKEHYDYIGNTRNTNSNNSKSLKYFEFKDDPSVFVILTVLPCE